MHKLCISKAQVNRIRLDKAYNLNAGYKSSPDRLCLEIILKQQCFCIQDLSPMMPKLDGKVIQYTTFSFIHC